MSTLERSKFERDLLLQIAAVLETAAENLRGLLDVGEPDELYEDFEDFMRACGPVATDRFKLDVEKARSYFAAHQEPHGGWLPQHLMFGAKVPTLGEYGEGNDDLAYATRVCAAALSVAS